MQRVRRQEDIEKFCAVCLTGTLSIYVKLLWPPGYIGEGYLLFSRISEFNRVHGY